jgi:hypothetical protein
VAGTQGQVVLTLARDACSGSEQFKMIEWAASVLLLAVAIGVTLWTSGAIYYDVGDEAQWGWYVAVGWSLCGAVLLATWRPLWCPAVLLFGVTAFISLWWLSLKPRLDREWDASVAVLPRATREGDVVTIENVRNSEYLSFNDFTTRYESRPYHLAHLRGADIIFFYWGSPWMSHPVLVFDFGPDGRVCMSIEVRFRKGQRYAVLPSLYRQQELIYLVVDERDAILRRTKHGHCDGYLYRLQEDTPALRTVFLDYVAAINDLYDNPCWYNALCANCTTSFYRLPHSNRRCDWRVIVNGRLDRALYEAGRLDRSIPFEKLRRTSYINALAEAAPTDGFGDYIRSEIERLRHE